MFTTKPPSTKIDKSSTRSHNVRKDEIDNLVASSQNIPKSRKWLNQLPVDAMTKIVKFDTLTSRVINI